MTAWYECIKRTARRVRVRIVQLERDALDEVAQVVRAADDVRVRRRGSAAHSDGPAVRVIGRGRSIALARGEHGRGVAVDERAVDADALGDGVSDGQERTARRAHSDADALCVGHGRLRGADWRRLA